GRSPPATDAESPSTAVGSPSAEPKPAENGNAPWHMPLEFDGYQVKGCIGKGAIGRVYRAYDPALDRSLAIKVIDAVNAAWYRPERFLVEARAAARVHHANLLTIYRIGEVLGRPYMATELVTGDRIDEIRRPVPSERALRIAVGLARGLAAAYRGGVLHRDIKPGNVIVTHGSEVKILDFGLAKLMEGADPGVFLSMELGPRMFPKSFPSAASSGQADVENTIELWDSSVSGQPTQELTSHG